ncbi:hypothetical protein B566_EDAN007180 [Ephemera danica]|nr:hypothetical protein B566_EDAN007180 [Ephemera danica]
MKIDVYVAHLAEERRQLLEQVGPELQSEFDSAGLEVQLVDMHYCAESDASRDPWLLAHHAEEVERCCATSRGCFFIVLVGDTCGPRSIPLKLSADDLNTLKASGASAELLDEWYVPAEDQNYKLRQPTSSTVASREEIERWSEEVFPRLQTTLVDAAKNMKKDDEDDAPGCSRNCRSLPERILQSTVEAQFSQALVITHTPGDVNHHVSFDLGLAPSGADQIVAVLRRWEGLDPVEAEKLGYHDPDQEASERLDKFRARITAELPTENVISVTAPWREGGVDPDCDDHEAYLARLRELIGARLQELVSTDLDDQPDPLNGRSKATQDVLQESSCHLALWRQHLAERGGAGAKAWTESSLIDRIRSHCDSAMRERHGPLLVHGAAGRGKSALLSAAAREAEKWVAPRSLARVIRFSGATPRSAYGLELLRGVCQHVSLILGAETLPKDCSFDPLYVNNWFGTLVRRAGESWASGGPALLLLLDDLQRLQPLDSDIVAPLSWLPVSLPPGVLVLAATATHPDLLKFTPLQKERLRAADCYLGLGDEVPGYPPLAAFVTEGRLSFVVAEEQTVEGGVGRVLDAAEMAMSRAAVARVASLLACAEFGLTELELLELLMPANHASGVAARLEQGHCNFSTLCAARNHLAPLLREVYQSGRLMLRWRHAVVAEVVRLRYLQPAPEAAKTMHAELANLFFSECEQQQQQQQEDVTTDEQQTTTNTTTSSEEGTRDTPFQSAAVSDVTYSARHVEESWLHLLKAGDPDRLKRLTVCNFDFLLAAVQAVSVSYLRCVLEHVRCYLLDRHLELVYYAVRKSSDVLTRDPLQLAAQVICWLANARHGSLMESLVTSAMAWCDGFGDPLLVPLTSWLQAPLPLQIKSVAVAGGLTLAQPTVSGQHVVLVASGSSEAQLWHVMSGALVHTFRGHSRPILCIAVTAHVLLTGAEDLSVIAWDLKTRALKLRIHEHIAPVLSVVAAPGIVASGGEDSRVIVTSLVSGEVAGRIDHHRGPVTCVAITAAADVLVSGSADASVCLWSLENFSLLNSISLPSPVTFLDVSMDSVFLLAACDDNQLYLRSLATGSEVHCLRGHKAEVRSMCVAKDGCRAAVGGSDGRVYVFDMHSGRLARTLAGHGAAVTAVRATQDDDFLLSAGVTKPIRSSSGTPKQQHSAPLSCLAISRDGSLAVTGSLDGHVNLWQLNSHDLYATLEGHSAPVTCVTFAPNGLFAVSGSEDHTARVWGLTLSLVVCCFTGHQGTVSAVAVMSDSRRAVSSDRQGTLAVWLADSGQLLQSCAGPGQRLAVAHSMHHVVYSNPGDHSLRIWAVLREDERYTVSHSEEVTCFALTSDSQHVITGSKDMSLKVWQLVGGKLAQVLVGHTDHVTCVAANKSLVVSGSRDANLIVWDILTGADLHTLTAHLGYVTCVQVSADGTLAVSGSEDRSLMVWDLALGRPRCSLSLHAPVVALQMSCDAARLAVQLLDCVRLPIVCLHNTPAAFVPPPSYVPVKEPEDTYTWQRKYGHLTSKVMIAAIDERLKRRFSVSASMEEISQTGPEQAALAQSQHFEHLEALWNKRSPPRRRHIVKQSSLASRRDSSDAETPDESEGQQQDDFVVELRRHRGKSSLLQRTRKARTRFSLVIENSFKYPSLCLKNQKMLEVFFLILHSKSVFASIKCRNQHSGRTWITMLKKRYKNTRKKSAGMCIIIPPFFVFGSLCGASFIIFSPLLRRTV